MFHTFHFGNYPNLPKKYFWAERLCSRIPAHLISVSKLQRKQIIENYKVNRNRITTIYNGADENRDIGNHIIINQK